MRRALREGDVFRFIVPGQDPHPAVVLWLAQDRIVVAQGTHAPDEEDGPVIVKPPYSRAMDLDEGVTYFYRKYVTVWLRPTPVEAETRKRCLPRVLNELVRLGDEAGELHAQGVRLILTLPRDKIVPLDFLEKIKKKSG